MIGFLDQIFRQILGLERGQTAAKRKRKAGAAVDRDLNLIELVSNAFEEGRCLFGSGIRKNDRELVASDPADDTRIVHVVWATGIPMRRFVTEVNKDICIAGQNEPRRHKETPREVRWCGVSLCFRVFVVGPTDSQ